MHNLNHAGAVSASPLVSFALEAALPAWDGLLDRLPIGVYAVDRDGVLVRHNRRAAELWGGAPETVAGDIKYCGALKAYRADGTPLPPSEGPVARVLATAEPVRDQEIHFERPDGSRVAVLANADPLLDSQGALIGAVGCLQDISAQKLAEDRLRKSEQRSRAILQALPAAVYTTDAEGRITFYNKAAAELAGREPKLGLDRWCVTWRLFTPGGTPVPHDACPMAIALKEDRAVHGGEAIAERPDGTRVPVSPYPTPLHDDDGRMIGAVNMLVDISAHKQAEARQKALIDELNHRVKNTLATVQALATQTIRGDDAAKEVRDRFSARLFALSRAHDRLTCQGWQSADLRSIVEGVFAPYDDGRVSLEGDAVPLSPRTALTLAMVLHELATNAAKYGALSAPGGRLALSWQMADEAGSPRLHLAWEESGGPPVTRPERRGFGSRLVERSVVHQLNGAAELQFRPAGVLCRMDIPLSPRT